MPYVLYVNYLTAELIYLFRCLFLLRRILTLFLFLIIWTPTDALSIFTSNKKPFCILYTPIIIKIIRIFTIFIRSNKILISSIFLLIKISNYIEIIWKGWLQLINCANYRFSLKILMISWFNIYIVNVVVHINTVPCQLRILLL